MQSLLTAVIKSDGNNDFYINNDEMETLILRLHNIEGVTFDEHTIRRQFHASASNSMASLFGITKSVLQNEKMKTTMAWERGGCIQITMTPSARLKGLLKKMWRQAGKEVSCRCSHYYVLYRFVYFTI